MVINKSRYKITKSIYYLLIAYILLSSAWWFWELNDQNNILTQIKLENATSEIDIQNINAEQKSNAYQYLGEGLTFLVFISAGFIYSFRALKKEFFTLKKQQNFMMGITHELKTPIAITQLNLQTLQKRKLTDEQKDMIIQNSLQETNRLNSLCNNLLFVSKIDDAQLNISKSNININVKLAEIIETYRTRFKIIINFEISENEIFLNFDNLLFEIVINNIIENAIKYTPEQLPLQIIVNDTDKYLYIKIADLGNGIEDAEKKKVFNKFYRLGNKATQEASGTGLGLYLVSQILKITGGKVIITDNIPNGTIINLTFLKQ